MSKEKKDQVHLPWYDSWWLESYEQARKQLRASAPEKLRAFEAKFDKLRTRPDFEARKVGQVLSPEALREVKQIVAKLKREDLEFHELDQFGRILVHDHPGLEFLHRQFTARMCEWAAEPVEPSYSFLCMYLHPGACPIHMDDPSAKWTLSICLSRTVDWPFYVGPVEPWPEAGAFERPDWADIKRQETSFRELRMDPGEGVIFSGSSQWHFREALPNPKPGDQCDLLLLHYKPVGQARLLEPGYWAEEFGVPVLSLKTRG